MSNKYILKELSRYQLGTFADIIYRNALLYPDKEAILYHEQRVTFSEYNRSVNRLIHALQEMGLRKGSVVGVLAWNCLEFMVVWGAAMKAGYIIAPYNTRLKADEVVTVVNNSEAKVVFAGPEFISQIELIREKTPQVNEWFALQSGDGLVREYAELTANASDGEPQSVVMPDDLLNIFYSSGTTGDPKGAVYSHRSKMENTTTKALDIGLSHEDRNLIVLPMFHIGGDSHIWPFFLLGCCNVIVDKPSFDPEKMLEIIEKEEITDVQIVPTQLVSLLRIPDIDKYDLRSLKRIWYAASPMPTKILELGMERFGPVFIQGYGMTESGPHTTVLPKAAHQYAINDSQKKELLGSCGHPCIGVHMRVVDSEDNDLAPGQIGEIIVRSNRLMLYYWHRHEETTNTLRDGWLRTGDMGYYNKDGYIIIADRQKDMIITGGENVYPKEVENVLYDHPAVSEAAVIGISDEYWVERVHACVLLVENESATEEEIIAYCKDRIAHYKAPKGVTFIPSFPKNPAGKILKKELRKQIISQCNNQLKQ